MNTAATPPAHRASLPRPLMIVATTLIVGGALVALRLHPANLLIGGFEIALGIGLIKLNPHFRIATLVWLATLMGVMALNAVLLLLTVDKQLVPVGGGPAAPKLGKLLMTVIIFTLAALGYRILKRPAIASLFFRDR